MVECSDGTLYTGWALDLDARISAHNGGRGARYTRSRRPVRLVWWEKASSRSEALKHEAAIRRLDRTAKLRLVATGA
jgi:putative endonuclease